MSSWWAIPLVVATKAETFEVHNLLISGKFE
ncbi:MAG: hypothetical protein RIQ52_300 [Pseudomonadota bacterium]|jgi:hypothetical protein